MSAIRRKTRIFKFRKKKQVAFCYYYNISKVKKYWYEKKIKNIFSFLPIEKMGRLVTVNKKFFYA